MARAPGVEEDWEIEAAEPGGHGPEGLMGTAFGRTSSSDLQPSSPAPRGGDSWGKSAGSGSNHQSRRGSDEKAACPSPRRSSPLPFREASRTLRKSGSDGSQGGIHRGGSDKQLSVLTTGLSRRDLNISGGSSKHLFEGMQRKKSRNSEAKKKAAMQAGSMPWLTIRVSGRFRQIWDLGSLCAVIYCTFIVPLDMCFDLGKNSTLSAIDITIEAFFLVDIVFNFFTSYLNDDGDEITSKSMIASNYLKSWFPIDASSSIPAESITRIAESFTDGSSDSIQTLYNLRIIRIVRLTKLLRLLRLGKLIEMIELSFPSLGTVVGLFRLLFMMLVIGHVQACGFYWVGSLNIKNSWVSKYHYACCDENMNIFSIRAPEVDPGCFLEEDAPPIEVLYADAMYWSFATLTTVGYGDITPCNEMEMLFCLAAMVVGSAIFAYIIGNISYVVTSVKGQELKLRIKMRELQEYIALRRVPKAMADVLRRQCLHRWKRTVFDEERILHEFTPHMRREVVSLINDDALLNVATFREIHDSGEEDFCTDLAIRLRPSMAQAGDEITTLDQHGGDLYIITSGQVQLLDKRGKLEAALGEKGYFNALELFAEAVLDKPMPYVHTAKAASNCEIYILRKSDFHDVYQSHIESNPNLAESLEDLSWKLWEDYEKKVGEIMKQGPSDAFDMRPTSTSEGYYSLAERQMMNGLNSPDVDVPDYFGAESENPIAPKMEAVMQYKAEAQGDQMLARSSFDLSPVPPSRTSLDDGNFNEEMGSSQLLDLLKMVTQIKARVKVQEENLDNCLTRSGLEYHASPDLKPATDYRSISREVSDASVESVELGLQGSPGKPGGRNWMHSRSFRRLNNSRKHYRHLDPEAKEAIRKSHEEDDVLHAAIGPRHHL